MLSLENSPIKGFMLGLVVFVILSASRKVASGNYELFI